MRLNESLLEDNYVNFYSTIKIIQDHNKKKNSNFNNFL